MISASGQQVYNKSNFNPSTTVEKIEVGGNMQGNITAGTGNIVGNYNVIYQVHTEKGVVADAIQALPLVRPRKLRGQPLSPPLEFVGRESELEQIRDAIHGKEPLLVCGLDGIGKTALLAQASNSDVARAMPDGVVAVEGIDEAGELLGLGDVVQRLFDALFESNPTLKATFPIARVHLSNTQPLVILDPLDLPEGGLDRLPNLFPSGVLLAATQDAPLDNRFRFLPVRPLARGASIQLFSNSSAIPLDKTTQIYMNEICDLLWDVPLAIVKTAVTIRRRDIALDMVPRTLAAIQPSSSNTIQAGIERSLRWIEAMLDEKEEHMLALVAAAPGKSVDRAWLESQIGGKGTSQTLESLELLFANNLRLQLPAGLRQALQTSRTDVTAQREDLLHHLLRELESRPRDLEFVGAELGNLLGLLKWASEQGRWSDAVALGKAVDPYLTLHGLWDAWEWVLRQVLTAGQNLKDLAVRGWALHQLGSREIGVGARDQAIRLLHRALLIRLSQMDMVGAAYTLHNLKLLLPPGSKEEQDVNDSLKKYTKTNGYHPSFWERWGRFLNRHFWILGAAVATAVIVAAILLPSLHVTVQASPKIYNPPGQVIEYTYHVDNAGLRKISGPVFVTTQDGIRVVCPDVDTVGNGDDFLDWNERITCSGFYKITATDVDNGSVKHTAVAGAGDGDGSPRSGPASIILRRRDRFVTLRIETNPTAYRNAGEIISVAYIVNAVGEESLAGRISVDGETLQADCPDIQNVGNRDGFLDLGERLACTASYTITDADVQAGQWKTTAAITIGNFKSDPQSITIFGVVSPALVLKKSAQPQTYQDLEQQIHYTYEVTNQGGKALNGLVEVSDDQVEVTCDEQSDVLEPGETRTCQAVDTISAADLDKGSLTNTATARIGNVESEPQSVTVLRAPPGLLGLKKSAQPQTYQASGEEIRYTYEVRNEGKDSIDGSIEVSDDRVAVTCEEQDGVLETNELLMCSGVYVIKPADIERGSLINTARASAGSVQSPDVSVTISFEPLLPVLYKSPSTRTYHQVGETIEYTYLIQIPGDLPAGIPVYVNDNKVEVDCTQFNLTGNQTSALAVREPITCTGTYTIKAEDIQNESVTNTAWAVVGNRTSEPNSVTIYYEFIEISRLTLKKSAQPGTYQQEGQPIDYMYFISNAGNYALKGQVRVEDGPTQVNCPSLREIGNDNGVFDPGEYLICSMTYLITEADVKNGSVTNHAQAWVGDIYSNPDSVTILEKAVGLEIAADPPGYLAMNDSIKYIYTVTGRNMVPLPSPATISDDRVKQDTCTPLNQGGNGDDFLDWDEKVTCTGSYSITQADIDPPDLNTDRGSLTNTAVASVGGVQSEPASLTIQGPVPEHDLLLEKAAAPGEYDTVGQVITYTYKITNRGNMTLFAFTVTDDHINNGAPFLCGEDIQRLLPGEFITCSREYQIAQTDFNFGNSSITNQAFATGQFQEKTVESSRVSTTIACPYPPEGWVPYQVEAGETLERIGTWYPNTPVMELQRLNCMGASTEVAGQTLYLPGNPPPAVLTGYVFTDPNGNLAWDEGELGVAGVPVTIRNEAGSVVGRTTTGSNGWYSFSNLSSGTYFVFQYRVVLRRGETSVRSFGIAPSLR